MGQASKLFNGNTDQTLIGRVTPTTEQREFLQQQWNDLADHLKQALAKHGYTISTWLQGSYKYATLIKPVHFGEEYDVESPTLTMAKNMGVHKKTDLKSVFFFSNQ